MIQHHLNLIQHPKKRYDLYGGVGLSSVDSVDCMAISPLQAKMAILQQDMDGLYSSANS